MTLSNTMLDSYTTNWKSHTLTSVSTAVSTSRTANTTKQTMDNDFDRLIIYFSPMLLLLSAVLIFFSIVTIYTICRDYSMRNTPSTILIGNLAVVDLSLALTTLISVVVRFNIVVPPTSMCELETSAYILVATLSLLFTFANSVDRYIYIRFPMKYYQIVTLSRSKKMAVVVWISAILFASLPMVFDLVLERKCTTLAMSNTRRYGSIYPLISLYVLCSFTIQCMYISLFRVVRKTQQFPRYPLHTSLTRDPSLLDNVLVPSVDNSDAKNVATPNMDHREQSILHIEESNENENKDVRNINVNSMTETMSLSSTLSNGTASNSSPSLQNNSINNDKNIKSDSIESTIFVIDSPSFTSPGQAYAAPSMSQHHTSYVSASGECDIITNSSPSKENRTVNHNKQTNSSMDTTNQILETHHINSTENIIHRNHEANHVVSKGNTNATLENNHMSSTINPNTGVKKKVSNIFKSRYSRKDLRTAKLLFILLGVYLILWIPTYILLFLRSSNHVSSKYFMFAYMLAMINSVINFFIYPMKVARIRNSLLYSLKNSCSFCFSVINSSSSSTTSNDRSII